MKKYTYKLFYLDKNFQMKQEKSFKDNDSQLSDLDKKILEIASKNREGIEGYIFSHNCQKYKIISMKIEEVLSKLNKNKIDISIVMERRKCVKIAEQRGIKYFVHFTRIENLHSILSRGLVPVSKQKEYVIKSKHNDNDRLDEMKDCTSCSVEFPNYKLFWYYKKEKYPLSTWVVILLNTDLLLSGNNIAYFMESNAAGAWTRHLNKRKMSKATCFEALFSDTFTKKDGTTVKRSDLGLSDSYTTSPQAEILFSGVIEPKYFKHICFCNNNDLETYIAKHGIEKLSKFSYNIDTWAFSSRSDYSFWIKG